jgi:glycosyltransferase involved in cell wall biosynthesis
MNKSRHPIASEKKVALAVVILTRNEEKNIGDCLRSLAWAQEIFVVDSESIDRTREVAGNLGAQVFVHPFDGYGKQRNWALEHLPFSNQWVLMLDADERVPAALAAEITEAVRMDGNGHTGFYLARRFIFLGCWLRYGGLYPTWILRLFKRHCVRFEERPVNEHAILHGAPGRLQSTFDHCDNRPLSDWIAKHNRYSDLEAEEYLQEKLRGGYSAALAQRWWGSQAERKRWIKLRVWNRLPILARPFLFFCRNYILKRGFLDGRPGLIYHVLWSFWYPFVVSSKTTEKAAAGPIFPLHPVDEVAAGSELSVDAPLTKAGPPYR